jgi:hypothetical protein
MKATEALRSAFSLQKKGKKVSAPHWDRGMVRYDARSFRIEKDKGVVGLATVAGRIKLPFAAHRQAEKWLDKASGFATADLLRRPSGWWLHAVVDDTEIQSPSIFSAQGIGRWMWGGSAAAGHSHSGPRDGEVCSIGRRFRRHCPF